MLSFRENIAESRVRNDPFETQKPRKRKKQTSQLAAFLEKKSCKLKASGPIMPGPKDKFWPFK